MSQTSDPRHYPDRPLVGVSAFIAERGSVVLVRRANPPLAWSLPGGLVELGETLQEAVRREVVEETGLKVEIERLATTLDIIRRDKAGAVARHFVLVVFVARPVGGTLSAGDDAAEAEWVAGELIGARELTPGTGELVARLLNGEPG